MSCLGMEGRLALYAGGDLPEWEAIQVREHVGGCSACRALLSEFQSDLVALGELREEALPSVVAAVMQKVRLERRPRIALIWAWAAIAAALVVTGVWGLRRASPVETMPPILIATARAPKLLPPAVKPQRAPRPRREPARVIPASAESFTVKMLTDDPNVVIYWIVDRKGD